MKGIYANRSPLFQIGLLFILLLAGFVIRSFLLSFIYFAEGIISGSLALDPMSQSVLSLQCTQFLSAICMFLLPALATTWLCSEQPKGFLSIRAFPGIRLLTIVCVTTLLLAPTVSLTGYFNTQIQLPPSMAALEEWMKSTEELAQSLIQKMIAEKGVSSFIINLIVIAVAAGVTEEFLFRGVLLRIVQRKIQNHHIAIWMVAIVFSAIHFQFYGFIPRMLLGAYLGYLLHWTKNIWVPVFAHFLHNAVALIGMSSESLKEHALFADEVAPEDIRGLSVMAGICLNLFFGCVRFIRKREMNNSS